ncbi:bifunctional folylpolyglutamate synthase/dihydrofolate synthase [candidate division WOR-3 bacterium]|nr:bifunctional folylpolyglutamate synthase/dihydrofolate synthase [candidate division WOR-3 bacterium]
MKKDPISFLYSLIDYERIIGYDYDLEAYRDFLGRLGAPHKKLKNIILIAGTKGKGSTAAIINACLMESGYRVGLYTSPHLRRMNERIRVNNKSISDRELNKHISNIRPRIKGKHRARTFFEILTTIAYLHFLSKGTDFAILEVGLGGRLDATNATDPLVSVITRIGYDHTNLLGTRLSQITHEKAAIIRRNGKLITIHQRPVVEKILRKVAKDRNCNIIFADELHDVRVINRSIKGSGIHVSGKVGNFKTFLPLIGTHQIENLSGALSVCAELRQTGFELDQTATREGIEKTELRGRFELISDNPPVIFDCAHNKDSFQALEKNLQTLNIRNFYLIFGTNKDKDIRYCLKYIFPKAKEVFLVRTDNPRAVCPQELIRKARRYQKNLTFAKSVKHALSTIKKKDSSTAIIITGSFYLWQREWKV